MNQQLRSTNHCAFSTCRGVLPRGLRSICPSHVYLVKNKPRTRIEQRAFSTRITNTISGSVGQREVSSSSASNVLQDSKPSSMSDQKTSFELVDSTLPSRKTKIVATIGPSSNTRESFYALADAGMNVVRLNMSHGDHRSHGQIVDLVHDYNTERSGNLAIMLDTKGPEVRSGDVVEPIEMKPGDKITFTINESASDSANNIVSVNYDQFPEDVAVGDTLLIDGGVSSLLIESIDNTDVHCRVIDGGILTSRRHLNVRGKSANLPAITERDWADINFGIDVGVDYFALSFVRDAETIHMLRKYLHEQGCTGKSSIGIIAKIETVDSIKNLDAILDAADGAMVARGDLGSELPVEEVPSLQNMIVQGCHKRGKPCIVATHMLESMIVHPTPTRAEVSDIAVAVKESTDAVMLSGETAHGSFPLKAVEVMKTVARRTEYGMLKYQSPTDTPSINWVTKQPSPSTGITNLASLELTEVMAYHAVRMADTIKAPLVVFSRRGFMPALLSHFRPTNDIFCFTDNEDIQRRLALYRGVNALFMRFSEKPEVSFDKAVETLRKRGLVQGGQLIVLVSSSNKPIWRRESPHIAQIRQVPYGDDVVASYSDDDDE